jgi:hypothetical protein
MPRIIFAILPAVAKVNEKSIVALDFGLADSFARLATSVAWLATLLAVLAVSVAGWETSLARSTDSLAKLAKSLVGLASAAALRVSTLLMKYAFMTSAASHLPEVTLPARLTSAGGSDGGALPRALLASCHNNLGSLLDLARVSALLPSLSRLTRRLVAFLRTQNLCVPAFAKSLCFIISSVSFER